MFFFENNYFSIGVLEIILVQQENLMYFCGHLSMIMSESIIWLWIFTLWKKKNNNKQNNFIGD